MLTLKKLTAYFFIVFALQLATQVYAQEYSFRHYSVEAGLASSEVYQVFQDSKGYVWFATDVGVSRFNGNDFTNFDVSDGLATNTIFEIFEDSHGKIWFLGMGNKLSYYYNDTIKQYDNQAIKKFVYDSKLPIKRSLYVDSLDNIYFSVMNRGILKLSANGGYENLPKNNNDLTLRIINLNGKLIVGHNNANQVLKSIIYDSSPNIRYTVQVHPPNFSANTLYFAELAPNGTDVVFTYNKYIYKLKKDKLTNIGTFENEIIWFSKDKTGKYWVSDRGKGIYCYLDDQFTEPPDKSFLAGKCVSSMLVDKEGGYWFTTLNNGVYYLPDYQLRVIKETENRNILDLNQNQNELVISTGLNELLMFDNELHYKRTLLLDKQLLVNKILFDFQLKYFWLGTYNFIRVLKDNRIFKIKSIEKVKTSFDFGRNSIFSMAIAPVSGVWLGTHTGINFIDDNKLLYQSIKQDHWKEIVYDIICNDDESLWLGTFSGLWKYTNGEYIHLAKQNPLFKHRVNTLFKHNSKLYVGTNGAGLLVYSFKDQSVKQIRKSNGLSSNMITDITAYKNSLWIGTNKGVNIIDDMDKDTYSIAKLSKNSGLLSNEIKRLLLHDSIMYIAGKKGVNYLDANTFLFNNKLLTTNIERITISDNDTIVQNKYELNHKQNNIIISYKAVSFKTEKILYRYKMLPVSQKWTYTNNEEIQFNSLAPGEYLFSVSAKNQNGQWNENPVKVAFIIEKPFWLNWWFIILIITTVVFIIIVTIHYKLHQIKKENSLKKELNLYMKRAINAQINPHFLFNSLNSINQYILKNDKINSSKYLNRFSNYMRSIFKALKNDKQSLSEELKISALYLELEKLRLKEKLSYRLNIDKSVVSQNVLIPSMIINPFLENAIWYGILPKKGEGIVDLSVHQKGRTITISVKDNGIGRSEHLRLKENPEFKLSNPGPENTLERINLLNKLYQDIIKIEYTDIEEGENVRGTIANIIIKLES